MLPGSSHFDDAVEAIPASTQKRIAVDKHVSWARAIVKTEAYVVSRRERYRDSSGSVQRVVANGEVVVAAGVPITPKLLMLSGGGIASRYRGMSRTGLRKICTAKLRFS